MLGGTDVGGGMQPLFMQARFGIEQFGVPDPEFPRGLVRIDPRPDIRLVTHPHHHPWTLAPAYMTQAPSGRSFGGLGPEQRPGPGKPGASQASLDPPTGEPVMPAAGQQHLTWLQRGVRQVGWTSTALAILGR